MSLLKNIWNWFDEKKTVIGTLMLTAAGYVPQEKILHQVLFFGGQLLGGVGIGHRVVKVRKAKKEAGMTLGD